MKIMRTSLNIGRFSLTPALSQRERIRVRESASN
jgi:hypothetical protein